MTTSSAFAEEIDGLNYKLDSETKTAILIPKTNGKYAGDIVVPEKLKAQMERNILLLLQEQNALMPVIT